MNYGSAFFCHSFISVIAYWKIPMFLGTNQSRLKCSLNFLIKFRLHVDYYNIKVSVLNTVFQFIYGLIQTDFTVQSSFPSIKQSPVLKGHLFLVLSQNILYELNLL